MGSILSAVVPESDIEAYQILHIHENSPARKADLEAFFDFIVALCGVVLIGNIDAIPELLSRNYDKKIEFKVFSLRTNTFRDVQVMPTAEWKGDDFLGMILNFCTVKDAYNRIQHVLEVYPSSPADLAGLRSFSDYIYGAKTEEENLDFLTLIKKRDQQELKLFVYNAEDDACRIVIIKPNSQWSGDGLLGCDLGTGCMHRIPTLMESELTKVQSVQPGIENLLFPNDSSKKAPKKSFNSDNTQTTLLVVNESKTTDESNCATNLDNQAEQGPHCSSPTSKSRVVK